MRGLRNAVQHSLTRLDSNTLLPSHLQGFFRHEEDKPSKESEGHDIEKLSHLQKQVVRRTLDSFQGNNAQTARALGISMATLYRRLKTMPPHSLS